MTSTHACTYLESRHTIQPDSLHSFTVIPMGNRQSIYTYVHHCDILLPSELAATIYACMYVQWNLSIVDTREVFLISEVDLYTKLHGVYYWGLKNYLISEVSFNKRATVGSSVLYLTHFVTFAMCFSNSPQASSKLSMFFHIWTSCVEGFTCV